MPAKKSGAKKGGKRKAKAAAKPMSDATKQVAAEVAGLFTTRLTAAGANVSIRESKNKDSLMGSARFENGTRVSLRVGQRG